MALTLPEDKKKLLEKELAAVTEKMAILEKFGEKVKVIEDFCNNLELFDNTNKSLDSWMTRAAGELDNIKNHCHQMVPEDRVAVCMELQEDIAAKAELERIHKFTLDLQKKVKQETANFSEDVKYLAEYRTGIREFTPWLQAAEEE